MTNAQVSRAFTQIADLMEIAGEDSFRVSSYRRVARTLDDLAEEITAVAARNELGKLPGVGKSSAEKIAEFLRTGTIELLEELKGSVPPTLLDLLAIPGLGPKKAAVLWRERGITSLESLRAALDSDQLDGLKGFAGKSIDKLREGLSFLQTVQGRTRLGVAWEIAERFRLALAGVEGVKRVEPAGSLRRGCETIGDLDLLCVSDDGARVIAAFAKLPGVRKVLVAGDTKGSVLAEVNEQRTIQVDLRVVPGESFGAAWQYFTGSKAHNVRLREMAQKKGWTLNEYSLSDAKSGKVIAGSTEEDIYAALGLPCLPPELREDRGEFALRAAPPALLTLEDMRGDLHMHTTASDGRASIEQMALAGKALGYSYVCITDHSQSSVLANGLKPERLREHIAEVRRIAKTIKGIALWAGAEVDIHSDGTLDYDDELLAELDWVVASMHIGGSSDVDVNTRRAIAAIRNPYVNMLAHPTARLLGRREAWALDIAALAKEAARTGTALEINASTYRLDLKDQHARLARDEGALLCINCDAHSPEQMGQMRFGVITARRGWLCRQDVLNTRTAGQVREFVARKRAAAK